jgi:hypothetical protein
MIQKIKQLFTMLAVSGALLLPLGAFSLVHAQSTSCTGTDANIQGCLNTGSCLSTQTADCPDAQDPNGTVNRIITTVINIFSLVVGVVSVIMIIIGGLRYITSGGDSGISSSLIGTGRAMLRENSPQ